MYKVLSTLALILTLKLIHFLLGFIYNFAVNFVHTLTIEPNTQSVPIITIIRNALTIQLPDSIIFTAFFAFIIYICIYRARKKNLFVICRFNKLKPWYILIFLLAGISLYIIIFFLNAIMWMTGVFEDSFKQLEIAFSLFRDGNFLSALIAFAIAAPIIEEILLRGLIMHELRRHMNIIIAIAIQAFLFGIAHMNLLQLIYTLLLGVVLGFIYIWTNSIWSTIIIHSIYNVIGFLIARFGQGIVLGRFMPLLLPISVLSIIAVCFFLYNNKEVDYSARCFSRLPE